MKIIELIPNLSTGGGEKFVIDLSNAFVDAGHECSIVTLYEPSTDDVLRQYVKASVYTDSLNKQPGADFRCMFRVAKYIKQTTPDVVHAHLAAIMYVLVAALICPKVKFFATIHSEASREAGAGLSKWIRKFLFKTKLVTPITISEESEKSFENFYGFQTAMIPNGCSEYVVDLEKTHLYERYREGVDWLFLHAGRIHKVKNQVMLIEAFEKILEDGINARLMIAGRAEDKELLGLIQPHFSDRIVYIGEQSDIRAIMSISDAFCLSSKMEGMPITIIEAMSVGCIPICTPVGGCINMVDDGVNGFLSKDLTVDSYASKIKECCNMDKIKLAQIKECCICDYTSKYSISKTAESYLNLFSNEK